MKVFNVNDREWRFGTTEDGTPYAVAADVAKSFDYRDASNALRVLDEDEKGTQIVSTPGGPQEMKVIYEDGLWELIFRSTKYLDNGMFQMKAEVHNGRPITVNYASRSGADHVMDLLQHPLARQ